MKLLTKYLKRFFFRKKRFESDYNQLYYNFHDLGTYTYLLSLRLDDSIKDLNYKPNLNIPYFEKNTSPSLVEDQLGKPVVKVDIDTLKGLHILHYKKIIHNQVKLKYNFHFYNKELVYYSEIYPYLNKDHRQKMFNDFINQQHTDCFEMNKRCVFNYQNLMVVVENSIDLSFHYVFINQELEKVFNQAKQAFKI